MVLLNAAMVLPNSAMVVRAYQLSCTVQPTPYPASTDLGYDLGCGTTRYAAMPCPVLTYAMVLQAYTLHPTLSLCDVPLSCYAISSTTVLLYQPTPHLVLTYAMVLQAYQRSYTLQPTR